MFHSYYVAVGCACEPADVCLLFYLLPGIPPSMPIAEASIVPMAAIKDIVNNHFVEDVYFFLVMKTIDKIKIMRLTPREIPDVTYESPSSLMYKLNIIIPTLKMTKMIGKTMLFLSPCLGGSSI